MIEISYESVAVSTRIRLARNFKDYPFPARLMKDPHGEEQANEMIALISGELESMDEFTLYEMREISDETAAYLKEQYLISKDLIRHKPISAAIISADRKTSVMINEEDHIREQYIDNCYNLERAYEHLSGIDELVSGCIPFAYDKELGYLTACPSNLGTGMRASVMLFLPAMTRRGLLKKMYPDFARLGLTVRGVYGEGSSTEGDLYQISNERTLGITENEILQLVTRTVALITELEIVSRARMKAEGGIALKDKIFRAYGQLTNCCLLSERDFAALLSDLKLGVALGYFGTEAAAQGDRFVQLNKLSADMRPAGIMRMCKKKLSEEEQCVYRADYISQAIRKLME